jgi:hypothetical protein
MLEILWTINAAGINFLSTANTLKMRAFPLQVISRVASDLRDSQRLSSFARWFHQEHDVIPNAQKRDRGTCSPATPLLLSEADSRVLLSFDSIPPGATWRLDRIPQTKR